MIDIDKEHSEYKRLRPILNTFRDLYAGGFQFKQRAGDYLLRRQKEGLDVYGERLERAFYQNYVGSIVDWYASTLFRREPNVQIDCSSHKGHTFLSEFIEDCDQRGTKLTDFFRSCLIDTLVAGRSYILIDFPKVESTPLNRAEEDATGLSRAYLVKYQAEDLINWSLDEKGDYEWIVLRQSFKRQPSIDTGVDIEETYWRFYDKSEYRVYRRTQQKDKTSEITLIARGPHAFIRERRVPLVTMQVSDGLWLLNKAATLQLEHFNKSNALAWAITMGLFAMPVVYSDREWNQILGESYYIQLGPSDKFGWAEPDGKVYQIAADNLEALKEEIYRVCYLAQASGEMISGHAQSAVSKQMDSAITQEVLRGYSSVVRDAIRKVLNAISRARMDEVRVTVSGLDEFDIKDFTSELSEGQNLLNLGIKSPTLKRQIYQRLAIRYLNDLRQETKEQIAREIDSQFLGQES